MIYLPMWGCSRSESSDPRPDNGLALVVSWKQATRKVNPWDRLMMWDLVTSILRHSQDPSN